MKSAVVLATAAGLVVTCVVGPFIGVVIAFFLFIRMHAATQQKR